MLKTTRDMSDRHEKYLAELFHGKVQPGSGNQFNGQTDMRQTYRAEHYSFAADGKSTLAKSITITKAMWEKLCEQAASHDPLLPLRFYTNERLTDSLDLVVLDTEMFAQILEDANAYRRQYDEFIEAVSKIHASE